MNQLQYNLFSAQRQLVFAKRHLEDAIAAGNADVKRKDLCPGKLIFMPEKTNREYFQAEVDVCQSRVDDTALALRRDKVLTKWAWRQIHRRERALTKTIPRKSATWFTAMNPDEVIYQRRLVEF